MNIEEARFARVTAGEIARRHLDRAVKNRPDLQSEFDDLFGRLNVALYEWEYSRVTERNIPIPETTVVRYECQLGSCDLNTLHGTGPADSLHEPESLFFMPFRIEGDTQYNAGWYCMDCIDQEIGAHLSDKERASLPALNVELDRRLKPTE